MWAKDANDFIHIQRINNATSIQDVSIYRFDDQRKLKSVMFAANGEYDSTNQLWVLSQVDESILSSEKNHRFTAIDGGLEDQPNPRKTRNSFTEC